MRWLWRHRALLGYLALVAIVVLALELHQHAVQREDARRDLRSCEQRQVLARNQAFVLRGLANVLQAELRDPDEAMPTSLVYQLALDLEEAQRRLEEENPIKPC